MVSSPQLEWTRGEFQVWAEGVVAKYPQYSVQFSGVGLTPGTEQSHGPASQIAVFTRSGSVLEGVFITCNILEQSTMVWSGLSQWRMEGPTLSRPCPPGDSWKLVRRLTFPHEEDRRTKDEKLWDEVML